MKTPRIHMITKQLLVVVLVLALLPSVEVARADATLDEQLIRAANSRDLALVKELLAKGVPVSVKDRRGHTPLMMASATGQIETMELLLEKGTDVNGKYKEGWTALK